ncbi:MAG: methyl-accepting chemotaxis protein [Actinomycetota bacterium]|nr:methyl-accepting chemotaxis protein [Actinomycetota bacterium]
MAGEQVDGARPTSRWHQVGVRTRITAAFALLVLVLVAGLVSVVSARSTAQSEEDGFSYGRELATRHAGEVRADFTDALTVARTLATITATAKAGGALPSRRVADDVHRDLLEQHPELLAVWTGWEPNAFDGRDVAFRNKPGHDATGRYVPYVYRDGSELKLTALADYDKPGAGDYYLLAKRSGTDRILEPYSYEVAGEQVLMTSITSPVKLQDNVLAVAGADVTLGALRDELGKLHPFERGYAALLSAKGTVVADPKTEPGKPAVAGLRELSARALKTGTTTDRVADDVNLGESAFQVAVPVAVGPADTWTLVVSMPMSEVTAAATATRNMTLAVGLATVLLATAIAWWLGGRLSRPILGLRDSLHRISAEHDLTARVDASRGDEIGDTARAVNALLVAMGSTVQTIRGRAETRWRRRPPRWSGSAPSWRPVRLRHRTARRPCRPPQSRSAATCRRLPPARRRWAPPSRRSPATSATPPASPHRR